MNKHMDPYEREKSLQKLDEAKAARGDDSALSARFDAESHEALREKQKKDFVYKDGTKLKDKSLDFSWGGNAKQRKKKSWLAIPIAILMAALMLFVTIVNKDIITSGDIHGFLDTIRPPVPLTTGTCGDNLTWSLSDDGVLTISGTGSMDSYADATEAPWASATYSTLAAVGGELTYTTALRRIVTVRIEKGVERISINAFAGLPNLRRFRVDPENESYATKDDVLYSHDMSTLTVYPAARPETNFTLPSTVVAIADAAFMNAVNLQSVTLHDGLSAIPQNLFATCQKLESIVFNGSQAQWEAIGGAASGLGSNVLLNTATDGEDVDDGDTGDVGLSSDLMYEFFAGACLDGSKDATLLDDMSTVHIKKGGYIEFTVYAEKAGVYALAMKENHLGGRLDYVRLQNFSVPGINAYTYGQRIPATSETSVKDLPMESYGVSASMVVAPYTRYYTHTYLQAGANRVRLSISGGGDDANLGLYSFRLDLVEADQENTVMVPVIPENPDIVIDYGNSETSPLPSVYNTGVFFRSGGKLWVTVNIPKTGRYSLSAFMNSSGGNLTISEGEGDAKVNLISKLIDATSTGSNALPYTVIDTLELTAGEHTLMFSIGVSHMNFAAIRFTLAEDTAIPPLTEMPSGELIIRDGEIDLFDKLTAAGSSKLENGVLTLKKSLDNAATATVTVTEAGVYLIRLAGLNHSGTFYLNNMSVAEDMQFSKQYEDVSGGYTVFDDGYSAYGFYQYLQKGENKLRIYSSSDATLTGAKMVEVLHAPTYVMISKDVAIESQYGGISSQFGCAELNQNDSLTYTFTTSADGAYKLSLIGNGGLVEMKVTDANDVQVGDTKTIAFNSDKVLSGKGAMSYLDTGITLTLPAGTYTITLTSLESTTTDRSRETYLGELFLTDTEQSLSGLIFATIDVPVEDPALGNLSTSGAVDFQKVGTTGLSGLTANDLLYVGAGKNNAVYFNVTAEKAGLYTLRLIGDIKSTYLYLLNPAFTGNFVSLNRDKDLGAEVGDDGYSKYVLYVFLQEGENQLKFYTENAELVLYAARLNYEEALPAALACRDTYGTGDNNGTKDSSIVMIRDSYGDNNYATYKFTPAVDGVYSFGLFARGSVAVVSLKDEDGNTVKVKRQGGDGSELPEFEVSVTDASESSGYLYDGSGGSSLYVKSGYYTTLTAGVEYTATVKSGEAWLILAGMTFSKSDAEFQLIGFEVDATAPTLNATNTIPTSGTNPTLPDNSLIESKLDETLLATGGGTLSGEQLTTKKNVTTFKHTVTDAGLYRFVVTVNANAGKLLLHSPAAGNASLAALSPVAPASTEPTLTYTVMQYLAAGENALTLTAGVAVTVSSVEVVPIKKVENSIPFKNFIGGDAVYPDRGYQADDYYLLRSGDSLLLDKTLTITEGKGIYFINAIVGGESYLSYSFKNVLTNEIVDLVYAKVEKTEGLSMTAQMLGYVQLDAGTYQVTVKQESGALTLLSSTSFTLAVHEHMEYDTVYVAPTCLVDGYEYKVCFCGNMVGEKTVHPAPGSHDWEETYTEITAPTCTEAGEEGIFCSRCDALKEGSTRPVEALQHDFPEGVFTVDKKEDCIHDGEKSIHCTRCDERIEITVIPATGTHAFSYFVTKEPTAEDTGTACYKCPICDTVDETVDEIELQMRPTIAESDVYPVTADGDKKIKITVAVSGIYRAIYATFQSGDYTTLKNTDPRYSVHVSQNRILDETKYNYVYIEAGEETVLEATGLVPVRLELVHADEKVAVLQKSVEKLKTDSPYTYESTIRLDGGFYYLSTFMYHTNLSENANITYTFTGENGESYEFSFKIADICVNEGNKKGSNDGMGCSASSTSTKFTELGGAVYLEAGRYTVTVSTDNTATNNTHLNLGSLLVTQNTQYPVTLPDLPVEDGGILK